MKMLLFFFCALQPALGFTSHHNLSPKTFGFSPSSAVDLVDAYGGDLVDAYGGDATTIDPTTITADDDDDNNNVNESPMFESDDWLEEKDNQEAVISQDMNNDQVVSFQTNERVEEERATFWDQARSFFAKISQGFDDDDDGGTSQDSVDRNDHYYDDDSSSSSSSSRQKPEKGRCQNSKTTSTAQDYDHDRFPLPNCARFDPEVVLEWKDVSEFSSQGIVVLTTQCSLDRLEQLEQQLRGWDGYAAVSIYARQTQCDKTEVAEELQNRFGSIGKVSIALVEAVAECDPYPINFLRNTAYLLALEQHQKLLPRFSSHLSVLLVDVDFVPSVNLYCTLHTAQAQQVLSDKQNVVVVPAFETTSSSIDDLPQSLSELKNLVEQDSARGFHVDSYPQGHSATQFDQFWERSTKVVNLDDSWDNAYAIKQEEGFEPYIVLSAKSVPLYDERFQGYGLNKVSHLASVADMVSSTFVVLPGVFLVAASHPPSHDRQLIYGEASEESRQRKETLRDLYNDFCSRLRRGDSPVVSTRTNAEYLRLRKMWGADS